MMNLVALALISFFSASAWAQTSVTDGVLINADHMVRNLDKKTVKLKGNVQVVFQGQHLACDNADLDLNKEQINAQGHVVLSNERVHVEGDRLTFNYKQNTGFIYNGFVQSGQVIFEGDVVQKIGEDHYVATNAFYTPCDTCPPGWSFSGRKIDAQLGGYARIQRPVFRVAGVPILILPGLIVPLKTSRQSGVLVPTMEHSQHGGFGLGGHYFWAINRSQDAQFSVIGYQLRGFKLAEDYRYILSKDSRGDLRSAWISDRELKKEYNFGKNIDRYYVNYDHLYVLPDDYVQRADIRLVSDLRYTRDFPDELLGHGDPALENKVSISKVGDSNYASVEADLYTNLLRAYPLANNDDAVHRAPEIRYNLKETELGNSGFFVDLNVDYANFQRNGFGYDDLEPCALAHDINTGKDVPCIAPLSPLGAPNSRSGLDLGAIRHDGVFNHATDLQRTGQRLDVQPTVSYPFQLWRKFDILPSVSYRETQYRFDVPSDDNGLPAFGRTAARRYLEYDISARTEFSHVYGDMNDSKASRWKHSIAPEIGYSATPLLRKPNDPAFFGDNEGQQPVRQFEPINDSDIGNSRTGVQFDYNDRTYNRRLINLGLDSRLTRKTLAGLVPSYMSVAHFTITQSYDMEEAQRRLHAHPWSSIDSLLQVRVAHFENYTTMSYNPYARKNSISTLLKAYVSPQNYLQLSYTDSFILNEEDFSLVPNSETRNIGVGGGFALKYVEAVGEVDYSDITNKINSWNYGLKIRPPGNCWLIYVRQQQILGGDARFYASLSFDFGGDKPPAAVPASTPGSTPPATPQPPQPPPPQETAQN